MCTCVISSLSNATVMSLSTNSPAETCDTLLLLVISVCCHFIYNLFVLQAYKIELSRRGLTAILGDPVGFTKMTSYSLLLYLLQGCSVLLKSSHPPTCPFISHVGYDDMPRYLNVTRFVVFDVRMLFLEKRPFLKTFLIGHKKFII